MVRYAFAIKKHWHRIKRGARRKLDNYLIRIPYFKPKIKSGYTRNPLLKYPRNTDCFCGSRLKAKKCCLQKLKKVVPINEAELLEQYVAYIEKQYGK